MNLMMTIKTKMVELKKKKSQYSENEMASMTELMMAEINADIEVFSDVNTSGAQKNGGSGDLRPGQEWKCCS